jgi:hypothetical protein
MVTSACGGIKRLFEANDPRSRFCVQRHKPIAKRHMTDELSLFFIPQKISDNLRRRYTEAITKMKQAELGDDDEFSSSHPPTEENHSDGGNERYATGLTSAESKAVYHLKALVFFVLITVGCVVSWTMYTITDRGQVAKFVSAYETMSEHVVESFQQILGTRIYALSSLGEALTLHAELTNSTWPFVTLTRFQRRANVVRELSGAMFVQIVVIVEEEDREEWENYTAQEQSWIAEAVEYQERTGTNRLFSNIPQLTVVRNPPSSIIHYDYRTAAKKIFGWDENYNFSVSEGPGPYQVQWQSSPLLPIHRTNLDLQICC